MFKDVKQLATPKAVRVIGFFFLTYYSVNFSNEGDFSFCPGSLVGVQIIPYFVHEINRYLSSQSSVYPFSSTAIIHVYIPVNGEVSRCPGMLLQNHTWSAWMTWMFSPLSTNMFTPSGSITMLLTLFFTQSNSITMFLTDPCPYLHRSQFLVVILLILISICRYVRGSAGPAPVHARRYSNVTISYSGLGRQWDHCCLVILNKLNIFFRSNLQLTTNAFLPILIEVLLPSLPRHQYIHS